MFFKTKKKKRRRNGNGLEVGTESRERSKAEFPTRFSGVGRKWEQSRGKWSATMLGMRLERL